MELWEVTPEHWGLGLRVRLVNMEDQLHGHPERQGKKPRNIRIREQWWQGGVTLWTGKHCYPTSLQLHKVLLFLLQKLGNCISGQVVDLFIVIKGHMTKHEFEPLGLISGLCSLGSLIMQDRKCAPQSPVSPSHCRSGSILLRAYCHSTLEDRKYVPDPCITPHHRTRSTYHRAQCYKHFNKIKGFSSYIPFPIHTENKPNWNLNYPAVVSVRITQIQWNVRSGLNETMTGTLWSWGTEVWG